VTQRVLIATETATQDRAALDATRPPAGVSTIAGRGLEVVGLGKRYGELAALDGCSLSVRPGRVVGLLGPNGAGKTTTMRCIFGLVEPDRGEVRWEGAAIDREARLRFGYMPEERGLYPHMRIRAQLEYLAQLSGLDRRSAAAGVERWLARLGLRERGEARLDALSHGNQQRVQLAAALVHDPVALVLDEPFAGLDPLGVDALSMVIGELAADGTAVLFSSHQLDLVEDVCQDIVVIDHGRVVLHGELDGLRAASSRRYLAVGFRGTRRWTPELEHARVLAAEPGRTRLELTDGIDLEALVKLARSAGELTRFSLEPPALSDLFREAVRR
jgi:ABC-2 type transport system ATP-binding protein